MEGKVAGPAYQRITWNGYEFLEAAKDDTRWNKAKSIMHKTGGMLFDVLKEILKSLITQELALID